MAAPRYMAVQAAALIFGAVLLLIGVLGFVPGVTSDLDRLRWLSPNSEARLFGIFVVSVSHNIINLVIGALGLVMARTYAMSRAYFLGSGVLYLAVWIYGLATARPWGWLTFALGTVMVILGLTLAGQHDPTKRRRRARA